MSIRVDTSSWIPGAIVCGNRGLGVMAEAIPSDGDNGPSYLYNDVSLPADTGKEICGRITTWPLAGTLYAYEDGAFEFSGAPDGIYSFQYQLYVDGVASGTGTVSLQVGESTVTISATTANVVFAGSAGSGAAVSIDAIADGSVFAGSAASNPVSTGVIGATTADAAFLGGASCGAAVLIVVVTQTSKFSGSAASLPESSALIGAPTGSAVFIGSAVAEAQAAITAFSSGSVFSGSASVSGLIWPAESDVRLGVSYGPTGIEYTGTMTGGSGPSAADIAAAVVTALNATTIPVDVQSVKSNSAIQPWPTTAQNADAVWSKALS